MPTYDYYCENCGDKFEHFQSMSSSPLRKCAKCGKMSLKRLIGAGAGIIFKGSGFYETDYRSESYKQGQSKSKQSSSSSTKSDKKDSTTKKTESSSKTKTEKKTDKSKKQSA